MLWFSSGFSPQRPRRYRFIFGLNFLGGLMPLNGADHVLHILTTLLAFGAYLASRGQQEEGTVRARRTPSAR